MKVNKIIKEIGLLTNMQEKPSFDVLRFFGAGTELFTISGDQLALSNTDGDFGTMDEWKDAVEYLVDQLGGTISWDNGDTENGS